MRLVVFAPTLALVLAGTASAAPSSVELTWLVSGVVETGSDGMPRQPVELVVAVGGAVRQVKLRSQFGQRVPMYQSVCGNNLFTAKPGELAQINFEEGGFAGYLVRRGRNDTLEVVEWYETDGACEEHGQMTACPRQDKLVASMHVPAGIAVHERVFDVDAHGKRTAFSCK
jgi:hypothetical protein